MNISKNVLQACVYAVQKARSINEENWGSVAILAGLDGIDHDEVATIAERWLKIKEPTAVDAMNAIVYMKMRGQIYDTMLFLAMEERSLSEYYDTPTSLLTVTSA